MAAEPEKPAEGAETKGAGGGKGGFIVALLLLAVVGAGAGAGFSLMFLRTTAPAAEQASAAIAEPAGKKPEAGNVGVKAGDTSKSGAKPEGDARKEQVAGLDPILVTLAGPQRAWARLELGVVLVGETKEDQTPLLKAMTEDLMTFMRTVPLTHVESAAGVEYLREDLSEIVRLRSKGRARGVVLRSLVVE